MAYALEKEQVVAGFINTHKAGIEFTLNDINEYIRSLWNAGVGPIILNFTQKELKAYLDTCDKICLDKTISGYRINKNYLNPNMSQKERELLHNNEALAKSFDLFCKLRVDLRTPELLLDAMGFHYIYAN